MSRNRAEGREGCRARAREKAIDAHPLTRRASLSPSRERRATPARAVAAVMAAHANQHGAETPSRATHPDAFHRRVYVCTHTRTYVRTHVHARAGVTLTTGETKASTERPTDRQAGGRTDERTRRDTG